jgi:hypothetical protein
VSFLFGARSLALRIADVLGWCELLVAIAAAVWIYRRDRVGKEVGEDVAVR